MFPKNTFERVAVEPAEFECIKIAVVGSLCLQRYEFAAEECLFLVIREVVVQAFFLDVVEVRVNIVHVAIFGQQLDSSLWADFGNAWNVVARVSHERKVIADFFWRNAVFFKDLLRPKINAVGTFFQMEKVDFIGHDLRHVLVFTDNHDMVKTCIDGGFGSACHHVVGFVAGLRQKRNSTRFHRFAKERHLGGHFFGHRAAIGFVIRVKFMAESLCMRDVASDCKMRGLVLCQNAEHRTPVTVHHGNIFALAVDKRVLAVSVEHAERECEGIKKE